MPAGTEHRICVEVERGDGSEFTPCILVTGTGSALATGTDDLPYSSTDGTKEYGVNLGEYFLDSGEVGFGFDSYMTIKALTFSQDTALGNLRSRFYLINVINPIGATLALRNPDTIKVRIDFEDVLDASQLDDFDYVPWVSLQDEFGDYSTEIPGAARRAGLDLADSNSFTVTRLSPGRRYTVLLRPVNAVGAMITDGPLRAAFTGFVEYTSCA